MGLVAHQAHQRFVEALGVFKAELILAIGIDAVEDHAAVLLHADCDPVRVMVLEGKRTHAGARFGHEVAAAAMG